MNKKIESKTGMAEGIDRDVPEHLQEDIMQRIIEAAWAVGAKDPDISIDDLEQSNVLNIEFTGTILIEGVEHTFHIRDGDMAGTEILSWNGDTAICRDDPVVTTLVPLQANVHDAIYRGRADQLLKDWDAALNPLTETGASLSRLPRSAAYDAFFAPGTSASRSHHQNARAAGYEIEEMDTATRVRAELLGAAFHVCPVRGQAVEPAEVLRNWSAALVPGSLVCQVRDRVIAAIAARGASMPGSEDQAPLLAEGYQMQTRPHAFSLRASLTRKLLSLEGLEGFDPADLPENPVAVLFHRLDPALVSDTRVNPDLEGERLLDAVAKDMARAESLEVPTSAQDMAARIGFRILNLADPELNEDLDIPSP